MKQKAKAAEERGRFLLRDHDVINAQRTDRFPKFFCNRNRKAARASLVSEPLAEQPECRNEGDGSKEQRHTHRQERWSIFRIAWEFVPFDLAIIHPSMKSSSIMATSSSSSADPQAKAPDASPPIKDAPPSLETMPPVILEEMLKFLCGWSGS